MYGFRKRRIGGSEYSVFEYPYFIKGRSDLLRNIQRRTAEPRPSPSKKKTSKAQMAPLLKRLYQLHDNSLQTD